MVKEIELGKRIAWLRTNRGLEQKAAAEAMGILYGTYQPYEYGKRPSWRKIEQILSFYQCSKSWLLTGEGVPYPDRPQEKPDAQIEPSGMIEPFNVVFDDEHDLPPKKFDALLNRLKKLTRNDTKRVISSLIVNTRHGDIDGVFMGRVYAVMMEFYDQIGKRKANSSDFVICLIIHTIYREQKKIPTSEEIRALIEALHALGKVFPYGVPLTPHEQFELFSWGQLPASEENITADETSNDE